MEMKIWARLPPRSVWCGSAAAHSMAEQAQALRDAVAAVKIDDAPGYPNAARAPRVMTPCVVMPHRTSGKTPTRPVAVSHAQAQPARLSARRIRAIFDALPHPRRLAYRSRI
jgi:hypothetical protein